MHLINVFQLFSLRYFCLVAMIHKNIIPHFTFVTANVYTPVFLHQSQSEHGLPLTLASSERVVLF